MAQLNSQDLSRKVIAIHGMGGLGKTSLATKLYNSGDLRRFDTRGIVCVSNDYNIKEVLKQLIRSFMGIQHEDILSKMDARALIPHLQKLLQDRGSYFLVIDDIWGTEGWEQIKIALPNQNNGSRVIVTTRNKRVAEIADDKCFVHHLRFLTEEESWELFRKRAEPTPNLEKIGKEIVGKCGGLPLAILVLSGLLLHNKNEKYWSNVNDHIWRRLKDREHENIEEILSLSYIDLSIQMRDCFLYVARFPEDHFFDVHMLKLLWIAEELIAEDEEIDIEDLAEDCLNELINRNLIQIAELTWSGIVDKCRVHDLVRELAIDKAKEEEKLVIFYSSRQRTRPIHLLGGETRHVIYNGVDEYLKLFERRFSKVRSLAVMTLSGGIEEEETIMMCTRLQNLSVLDLTSLEFGSIIPKEIGNLVHLKFLGLFGGSSSIEIPASIGKLKKLQTLCGPRSSLYYKIPKEIWELEELRNITGNAEYYGNAEYFGRVMKCHQNLHTLEKIGFKEWVEFDTLNMNNLRTLSIIARSRSRFGGEYTLESIANLKGLQTFSFFAADAYYSALESNNYAIPTIKPLRSCKLLKSITLKGTLKDPSELNFLPEWVTILRLRQSGLTEDPMPTLGNLTNLTALELYDVYSGKKMVCNQNAFPSLQILHLRAMSNLRELQVEDGALPSLLSFKTNVVIKCLSKSSNFIFTANGLSGRTAS